MTARIAPSQVHDTLHRHMLADGYDIVLDLEKSQGRRLYDSRHDRTYLDLFSFFATLPIGFNHPKTKDPDFLAKLTRAALVNPTNSDVYTTEMAEFVDTFGRVAKPASMKYAFFVAGGALGVENALKAAMDWKVRRNFAKGIKEEKGHQILHFREAFHGRSGYTVSMTNTADPRKYQYFAKFDWPRVSNPGLRFPVTDAEIARVQAAEAQTLAEVKAAFAANKDDIAAILIEPIQAEGGDNHFRKEFLVALKSLAHENDALLIWDEVQTGIGITGSMWAHQAIGVDADLVAFGKKMQVCGCMAGGRIDEEPDNVFHMKSRINSTWGGNLVDMVRCEKYLQIIEEEKMVENAATVGAHLLKGLQALQSRHADVLSNARGRGLMCAIDFPDGDVRAAVGAKAYEMGMIILPCGTKSLRFRPPLDITAAEVDEALDIVEKATLAVVKK
ncbi:MAG: L-lysine 6-transaminase [Candidatus Eisenbacteria bacterium]|uniref:L-lysine-epsilon aminotransferase n=1 Tax=Eiseniibacteriota bacterium TaxID=2212470 RepID=A0A933SG72_UNCEI|nr:L-lysine 6-transaminase [Candidatus Eisenbacteria bacterium]